MLYNLVIGQTLLSKATYEMLTFTTDLGNSRKGQVSDVTPWAVNTVDDLANGPLSQAEKVLKDDLFTWNLNPIPAVEEQLAGQLVKLWPVARRDTNARQVNSKNFSPVCMVAVY